MSYVPFELADSIGDRFLALIERCGIEPPIGSTLEGELLSLTQLVEVMKNPAMASQTEQAEVLRSAAGLHDLAAKVLSVDGLPEFESFVPHLRLIGEAKNLSASLVQNAFSGPYDHVARKIAELYMACLVAHVGHEVELDSPTCARGENPDVMFKLQHTGWERPERWALAVKTISSRQGQTIFERIEEGAKQIDSDKCAADRGMVVVNTKSALDHGALWEADFSTLEDAVGALKAQLESLSYEAAKNRPQSEWDSLFGGRVVRPVLFMGQSVVRLDAPGGGYVPTALKMLLEFGASGSVDAVGHGLASAMNQFMQGILLGEPGAVGRFPR